MEANDIAQIVGLHISQHMLSTYREAARQKRGIALRAQWSTLCCSATSFGLPFELLSIFI